ncbi:calcium homeostasis modulator protein 3-like [Spea bombifrons]|uniref:calcium homeostasis modulator protein 3-like n=1 Tax=Spea bombifrons TaxID=233779 RepID=UPI002348F6D8|nr:calcium homeostasis modulator protein 3-like [Spea bombifrons]
MAIYRLYKINCPCLPGYNLYYGLIVMVVPPFVFLFLGIVLNGNLVSLALEFSRPQGRREKNKRVLKSLFQSVMIRALIAPTLWIIVSFLDGKSFVCAFSETLDPEDFGGFGNFTGMDPDILLAKVPCKNFELLRNSKTRKAISRFLKCISQGIGVSLLLSLIVLASLSRIVSSLFNVTSKMQSRYWRQFSHMEEKCFDINCLAYNYEVAENNVKSYFETVERESVERKHCDVEEHIISSGEMMHYVDQWYNCRPPIVYEIKCQ